MFGGSKKFRAASIHTLISRQAQIDGDIRFTGGLHVDGRIRGNVTAEGDDNAVLIVSGEGVIEGDVAVPSLLLHGTVRGDVYTSRQLELSAGARVTGNVCYNLLQMAVGAQINGLLLHREEDKSALESGTRTPAWEVPAIATEQTAASIPILDRGGR